MISLNSDDQSLKEALNVLEITKPKLASTEYRYTKETISVLFILLEEKEMISSF